MLARTVFHGNSAKCWNTMPRSGPGREEPSDQIEQGGFAAAGRAEQRQEFARAHVERNLRQRQHRPTARRAIGMVHPLDDDLALAVHGWDLLYYAARLGRRAP